MQLIHGDCLEEMKKIPDGSVDLVLTDPPYGLSFMGKKWDYDVPTVEIWQECLRVLKPGGHLLAFAGTRTQHRMAVRIEDAGFEIRDMIAWVYGSGFPKSLNIEKAINKIDGVEFDEVPASGVGFMNAEGEGGYNVTKNQLIQKGESSERAKQWEGWGTALKPALEPITVARKPLIGTVAENVLTYGTGGLNIDESRVGTGAKKWSEPKGGIWNDSVDNGATLEDNPLGRFPANLIHDGSEEVVGLFPESKTGGAGWNGLGKDESRDVYGKGWKPDGVTRQTKGDKGSAARFFYCASGERHDIMSTCKNTNARTVLNFLQTIRLTNESIVAKSATLTPSENLVQNVKSAGIVCDSCATAIAQSLVAMMTENTASQVIQACTTNYADSTPHQSLVEIVEQWVSTDTTPTTQNLLKLFGSVLLATDANTSWANKEVEEEGFVQAKGTRFLYQAKASKSERNRGCEGLEPKFSPTMNDGIGVKEHNPETATKKHNHHPTVKPIALMEYLVTLASREGATILDPFMGSGTTGIACKNLNRNFIGIEMESSYYDIAVNRINSV